MGAVKITQVDGDLSVRNVSAGGHVNVEGNVTVGHNLKVEGWLEAPNVKDVNKGVFSTVTKLREAHPTPHDGWFAGVGSSSPFAAYVGDGGDWVATGGTITIDFDNASYNRALTELEAEIAAEASAREAADAGLQSQVDGKQDKQEWDAELTGNGNTIVSVASPVGRFVVGRTYRVHIGNPDIDMTGVGEADNFTRFSINRNGSATDYLERANVGTALQEYYDITIPEGTEYLTFYMRAAVGAVQRLHVEDVTLEVGLTERIAEVEADIAAEASAREAADAGLQSQVTNLHDEVSDVVEYGIDDLVGGDDNTGRVWYMRGGVGTQIDLAMTKVGGVNRYFKALPRLEVKQGQTIEVSAVGGVSARAWALTDKERVILSLAENEAYTSARLTVEQDGYLYVNCNTEDGPNFFVKIHLPLKETVDELRSQVVGLAAAVAPDYYNHPLPLWKDTVKILAIGNSYCIDSLMYMPDFLAAANVADKVSIHYLYYPFCTLKKWNEIYGTGEPIINSGAQCRFGGGFRNGVTDSNTFAEILSKDWDVIVLQDYIDNCVDYNLFRDELALMMRRVKLHCPNPRLTLVWHTGWSHKEGWQRYAKDEPAPPSEQGWRETSAGMQEMMRHVGIDIVIPTGTAVQNARNTSLCTNYDGSGNVHPGDLTRDWIHMSYGVGRYVATATWFEVLIAPIVGVSVLGNTATHATMTEAEAQQTIDYPFLPVTDENRELCQRCALAAVVDRWHLTAVESDGDFV